MESVIADVRADLAAVIQSEFPDPTAPQGTTTIQGITNVAWGMIDMGLLDDPQCRQVLQLLVKYLDRCNTADLSMAVDSFAAAVDQQLVSSDTLAKMIRGKYRLARGQELSRYLYNCGRLGITDMGLKVALGEQLLAVEEREPQHCSNAALALSRQGVDSEQLVRRLAARMLNLELPSGTQDIANVFLALHERGWTLETDVARRLLETYVALRKWNNPYAHVQVLCGVEGHGVTAEEVDLRPVVDDLLRRCPTHFRQKLGTVEGSLRCFGYSDEEHLRRLRGTAA